MELGLACFGSIFAVIKTFDCDAVFAVDLRLSVCLDFLVTNLACHFNYSTCYMNVSILSASFVAQVKLLRHSN